MIEREPTCKQWTAELVEAARVSGEKQGGSERQPGRGLRAHLAVCEPCRERWEAEILLTSHLSAIRERSRAFGSAESRRAALMQDFVRLNKVRVMRRWSVALGAAAAVVVAVGLGYVAGQAQRQHTHAVRPQAVSYDSGDVLSMDASALSSDDFVAVPYTPPLAQGEMVRVVHAELYPDALATMGVDVDPAYSGRLPADVVVGEDGLPRAVRLTESNSSF